MTELELSLCVLVASIFIVLVGFVLPTLGYFLIELDKSKKRVKSLTEEVQKKGSCKYDKEKEDK